MSGLAAGIRLAHFGKRVCIFERHGAPGGLNSFYFKDGRKHDVGLHALTNYVDRGVKGTPLGRILRQLRLDRDELDLCPQVGSRVAFPGRDLRFTNDPAVLEAEVAREFRDSIDGYRSLIAAIKAYDDDRLDPPWESARTFIAQHISDPVLTDMLLCPLMYYGSSQENDMELLQFVIMAKSIFLEGFARPHEGVRRIIRVLLDRLRKNGGERRMRCGVSKIVTQSDAVDRLILDDGSEVTTNHVISSIGLPETARLVDDRDHEDPDDSLNIGTLGFVETISMHREQPEAWGWENDTIVFFNDSDRFAYEQPRDPVDPRSGVICVPNNFQYGDRRLDEGIVRVTCLADPGFWFSADEAAYSRAKESWFGEIQKSARRFLPTPKTDVDASRLATDMFTPRTVKHFTGHLRGAIYGAPQKRRTGRTHLKNLYLCGTDQGYLGIIGAMLSGITVANLHVLNPSKPAQIV